MKPDRPEGTPAQRILDAALTLFAAEGFAGASMEAVAGAAGVNKASIYYHVGDKAELYRMVLATFFGLAAKALDEAVSQAPDAASAMRALVLAMAGQFKDNPRLPRIMMHEWARLGENLPREVFGHLAKVIAVTGKVLARGRAEGVFREAPLWPTHLSIVAPLVMFATTRETLNRDESLPEPLGVPRPFAFEDMAAFVADSLIRSLTTASQSPPSPEGS